MLIKFKTSCRLNRAIFLLLLTFFGGVAKANAETKTPNFVWTHYPLKIGVLEFGATTLDAVLTKLLGPTPIHRGDGGNPTRLCYLQKLSNQKTLQLSLSFFGGGDEASLSGIEWRLLTEKDIPDAKSKCQDLKFENAPIGLTVGVQIGDLRTETRQVLGAPTKRTSNRDEYSKTKDISNGFLVTELELTFDSNSRLVALRVRQIASS